MVAARRPKLLWLHTHMLQWNGGARYVLEVTKRLAKRYDVTLWVQQVSQGWRELLDASGMAVMTFGGPHTGEPLFWASLPLLLRKYHSQICRQGGNPDLVISSMFPMNGLAAAFEGIPKIQICYEPFAAFHDPIWLSGFSAPKRSAYALMKLVYCKFDIAATRRADCVLTLSTHNAQWIKRVYGVDSKPVYEGVDVEFFQPTFDDVLEARYRDANLLLHFSDFTRIKGTAQLIEAMPEILRAHPNTLLAIPGFRRGTAEEQRIMRRAGVLGISQAIQRLGFLPDSELPAHHTLAKVVVQPSLNQSMSLPAKEGMACGTPVVRGLDASEEVVNGVTGFTVDVSRPSEIAAAINTLLSDETLRQGMGAAARAHVARRFTWEHVVSRIEDSLEEFVRL